MLVLLVVVAVVVGAALVVWSKQAQLSRSATPSATAVRHSEDATAGPPAAPAGPWGNGPVPPSRTTVSSYTSERLTLHADAPPDRAGELQRIVNSAVSAAASMATAAGNPLPPPQELASVAISALKNAGVSPTAPGAGIPLTVEVHSGKPLTPELEQPLTGGAHSITLNLPAHLSPEQTSQLVPQFVTMMEAHPEITSALARGDRTSAQSLAQSEVAKLLAQNGLASDPSGSMSKLTINIQTSVQGS